MEQYQGKSVFGGVAIGRIHIFSKGQQQVKRIKVQDTEAEKSVIARRFRQQLRNCRDCMIRHLKKLEKPMQQFLRCIR